MPPVIVTDPASAVPNPEPAAAAPALTVEQQATLGTAFQELATAVSTATNWTFVAGGGRSTTGQNNVAFADVAYNITQNVGLIIGGDFLWSKNASSWNTVKGGIALQATMRPFAFLGGTNWLTNIRATPFVANCIAEPFGGGSASIGNIVTGGLQFDVATWKQFKFSFGGQYENRSGQGIWNGNYLLGQLGFSRTF